MPNFLGKACLIQGTIGTCVQSSSGWVLVKASVSKELNRMPKVFAQGVDIGLSLGVGT